MCERGTEGEGEREMGIREGGREKGAGGGGGGGGGEKGHGKRSLGVVVDLFFYFQPRG